MSVLQWALLILGAIAVIGVYVVSRRERAPLPRVSRRDESPLAQRASGAVQEDLFAGGKFDEYGVGKPRRRSAPSFGAAAESEVPAPQEAPAPAYVPSFVSAAPVSAPSPAAAPRAEEKIIALLIAEREGTAIFGSKLHSALQAQKLQFGERQIYHRMEQGMIVFSVASLLKPGTLDPAEAAGFSTPGLSVFLVLPGPVKPVAAFQDMVATARALAKSLNADVYDSKRQLFDAASERTLKAEVETWARANHLG